MAATHMCQLLGAKRLRSLLRASQHLTASAWGGDALTSFNTAMSRLWPKKDTHGLTRANGGVAHGGPVIWKATIVFASCVSGTGAYFAEAKLFTIPRTPYQLVLVSSFRG